MGGRLSEYLTEEQLGRIDAIAAEVFGALKKIEVRTMCEPPDDPFAFLLDLKRDPLIAY